MSYQMKSFVYEKFSFVAFSTFYFFFVLKNLKNKRTDLSIQFSLEQIPERQNI